MEQLYIVISVEMSDRGPCHGFPLGTVVRMGKGPLDFYGYEVAEMVPIEPYVHTYNGDTEPCMDPQILLMTDFEPYDPGTLNA